MSASTRISGVASFRAGNYEEAAKAAAAKNGIKLYAGRTGMLSAVDFGFTKQGYTGSLYLESRGGSPIPLRTLAFAAAALALLVNTLMTSPKESLAGLAQ